MSWTCEIALTGDAARRSPVAAWLSQAGPGLAALDGLCTLDAYTATEQAARDPYNGGEIPPLLLLLAAFADEAGLRRAMADPVLDDWLSRRPDGTAVTVSALRRSFHAPDAAGTMPAPVSYVVRYLLPADDAAAFRRAYLAGLVPIQARLPGIRSILCYVLLADAAGRWPAMDYLIGNEVAFDSVDAFNAAMRSPARDELRTQSGTLPAYSGNGSHVLMRRERLFTAGRD
ncbi:MAG: hypothetical protein J0I98_13200 [Mesorhizobium sp.]|nr:hypothetical protein [Mesorhizobium sp.]MBN9243741.1 hypothetical protein [Mesorhizobium sp.]